MLRGPEAQRKVRETSGFVRGPSFEALAGVYASAGACILTSVRRAYLPHAVLGMRCPVTLGMTERHAGHDGLKRSSRRFAPQDDVVWMLLRMT